MGLKQGDNIYLNGRGDLFMDAELRDIIRTDTDLSFVKVTKSGLYMIMDNKTNKTYSVPKRNVEVK